MSQHVLMGFDTEKKIFEVVLLTLLRLPFCKASDHF
jgi:hypothetical protein